MAMSTKPQDRPGTAPSPLEEAVEKDRAGDPVRDILKEQVGDELKEDEA
jgi:hypothetical protein